MSPPTSHIITKLEAICGPSGLGIIAPAISQACTEAAMRLGEQHRELEILRAAINYETQADPLQGHPELPLLP